MFAKKQSVPIDQIVEKLNELHEKSPEFSRKLKSILDDKNYIEMQNQYIIYNQSRGFIGKLEMDLFASKRASIDEKLRKSEINLAIDMAKHNAEIKNLNKQLYKSIANVSDLGLSPDALQSFVSYMAENNKRYLGDHIMNYICQGKSI